MKNRLIFPFILALAAFAPLSISASGGDASVAARALNSQSERTLGIGIRSLVFLFDAKPGSYLLKDAIVQDGSWPHVMALQKAGYVTVSTYKDAEGEFIQLLLTPKGQQVLSGIGP